jgi:hypothetical protein
MTPRRNATRIVAAAALGRSATGQIAATSSGPGIAVAARRRRLRRRRLSRLALGFRWQAAAAARRPASAHRPRPTYRPRFV